MKPDKRNSAQDFLVALMVSGGIAFLCFPLGALMSACNYSGPKQPKPVVEKVASEPRGVAEAGPTYPIEVGRVKPGTETTDAPVRSEWNTLGEWVNVHGKDNHYLYVRYDPESNRYYLQACTVGTEGPVPSIVLGGASNQVWIEFKE
jgi:hypothetical protein